MSDKLTIAIYDFTTQEIKIKNPIDIIKETKMCYFTTKNRILKRDLGKINFKKDRSYKFGFVTIDCFLELKLINATHEEIEDKFYHYFSNLSLKVINEDWKEMVY